jgi:hypothetical protein
MSSKPAWFKKNPFVVTCLFFFSSFLLITSIALAADSVGKFTHVEGKVDVLRGGALPGKPVSVNGEVFLKDIVRTKSSAKAEVLFRNNTVLRIAQRSRIDISEYFQNEANGTGIVKLQRGLLRANVDKGMSQRISVSPDANRFEIHTPNAVAGVRGTDFFVLYERNTTTVLLREGEVCVYNLKEPLKTVCMPPNYVITVSGGNPPDVLRKAAETEFTIYDRETSPLIPAVVGPGALSGGDIALVSASPVAEAATSSDQGSSAVSPLAGEMADTPSSITDIPLSKPITEAIPETLNPPGETFESTIGGNIWSSYPITSDGSFNADMQGIDTLWTATQEASADTQITGTYSANSSLPHIWFDQDVFSFNNTNATNTTFDGGAYRGFIGGRETGNSAEAAFTGLYADPSGNTGILTGSFSGSVSGTTLMMNGGLFPVELGTTPLNPAAFYTSIETSAFSVSGLGLANDALIIEVTSGTNQLMNIAGQNEWGISQMLLGGTYTDMANDAWSLTLSGSPGEGYELTADLSGSRWSADNVDATAAGFWVDARSAAPSTGIYIGETAGTFNPADHTWQAISTGIFMETNRFLDMASTAEGRNKLTHLNIPAFEVGRTNLSGSLIDGEPGSFDFVSVSMNNVAFFAPSTGQKPGIWATNSVTGQYDFSHGFINGGNISNAENAIALSNGSGISADLQFKNWNAGNNTWSALVNNGTGNLSGGSYNGPVNFNGAAAGTHTGSNAGSLSGTGAGVAR